MADLFFNEIIEHMDRNTPDEHPIQVHPPEPPGPAFPLRQELPPHLQALLVQFVGNNQANNVQILAQRAAERDEGRRWRWTLPVRLRSTICAFVVLPLMAVLFAMLLASPDRSTPLHPPPTAGQDAPGDLTGHSQALKGYRHRTDYLDRVVTRLRLQAAPGSRSRLHLIPSGEDMQTIGAMVSELDLRASGADETTARLTREAAWSASRVEALVRNWGKYGAWPWRLWVPGRRRARLAIANLRVDVEALQHNAQTAHAMHKKDLESSRRGLLSMLRYFGEGERLVGTYAQWLRRDLAGDPEQCAAGRTVPRLDPFEAGVQQYAMLYRDMLDRIDEPALFQLLDVEFQGILGELREQLRALEALETRLG